MTKKETFEELIVNNKAFATSKLLYTGDVQIYESKLIGRSYSYKYLHKNKIEIKEISDV